MEISSSDTKILTQTAKSRYFTKWLVSLAVFFLLISSAAFLVSNWMSQDTPEVISSIESVMFEINQPSVMAHIDIARVRKLTTFISDEVLKPGGIEALQSIKLVEPIAGSSYFFNQIDFATAGVYVSSQAGEKDLFQESVLVATGRYDLNTVHNELQKTYEIHNLEADFVRLDKISELVNDFECPLDEEGKLEFGELFAHIDDSQIVIGSSLDLISKLVTSLDGSEPSNSKSLAQWQIYRDGALFAIQSFDRTTLKQDPSVNWVFELMFGEVEFNTIGLRMNPDILKRGVSVAINANSDDADLLTETANKIRSTITTTLVNSKGVFPTLSKMLSRITISHNESLDITGGLDSSLIKEFGDLISELLDQLFHGGEPNSELAEEKIDTDVWDYELNKSVINPTVRKQIYTNKVEPLLVRDELSILINSVGIKPLSRFPSDKDLGDAMQLTLDVARHALDFSYYSNRFDQTGIKHSFMITDVLDDKGDQLIEDERCRKAFYGTNLNHMPESDASMKRGWLESSKTVRLVDGTKIQDINRVKGWYKLRVAESVEKTNLTEKGTKTVEWNGGSLRLISVNNGEISYAIKGESTDLLNVVGLNGNGQYLSPRGHSLSDSRGTRYFSGAISSVEVIVAKEWDEQYIEFELDSIVPSLVDKEDKLYQEPVVKVFSESDAGKFASPLDLKQLNEEQSEQLSRELGWKKISLDGNQPLDIGRTSSNSAHLMFKHDPSQRWGDNFEAVIIAPFEETILLNPNTVSIDLYIDEEEHPISNLLFSSNKLNGNYQPSIEVNGKSYLQGTFSFRLENEGDQINSINGRITYSLPTEVQVETIDLNTPKNERPAQLTALDYGWENKSTYTLSKSVSDVYAAKLFTTDGKSYLAEVIKNSDGSFNLVFESVKNHQKIELSITKSSYIVREPFNLAPRYK